MWNTTIGKLKSAHVSGLNRKPLNAEIRQLWFIN